MPADRITDMDSTTNTPKIAVVSPTPRSFTFPINCNLAVPDASPVTTPSSSPFEPDLSPISFIPLSPRDTLHTPDLYLSPSHYARTPSRSPSLSPSRTSSRASSSPIPKKGDCDYIKRPENAFILFRRKCCEERAAEQAAVKSRGGRRKPRQADLSKSISQQWKSLPIKERMYWEDLAKEKKKEHEELYPGYVYRPQRSRDKDGNVKPRKPRGSRVKEKAMKEAIHTVQATKLEDNSHFPSTPALNLVVPSGSKSYGRSMSLPTPREVVEIPNVYSCPTSPTRTRMSAPGFDSKQYNLDEEMPAIDWAAARGPYAMPWGISWAPALVPCYFPNPEFSFDGGIIPLDLSPCMSSSSQSSLPSLDPFEFSIDASQFPVCDTFGMDVEVDFSSQPLNYASMAWEQANPAWGLSPATPMFDEQTLGFGSGNATASWGINGVPSMELSMPQESLLPSQRDNDLTPTGEPNLSTVE